MTVAVRTLADDVWAILAALPNVNAYLAEIPQSTDPDVPIPPVDPDGRVHPYLVAYFGGGRASSLRAAGSSDKVAWTAQVTCAGGDNNRALWCVDHVRAALTGKRVAGGILVETVEPGPPQRADNVTPARFWTPLLYRLNVTG